MYRAVLSLMGHEERVTMVAVESQHEALVSMLIACLAVLVRPFHIPKFNTPLDVTR